MYTHKSTAVALSAIVLVGLTACSRPSTYSHAPISTNTPQNHERLGTVWGDEIHSPTTQVQATRKTTSPITVVSVRYANKTFHGKTLHNISLDGGKISMSITDDNGKTYPITRENQDYYLSAKQGDSYTLRYQNHTAHTYEVVASVDGLDVLTGDTAFVRHTGYVLRPHSTLSIDGFRKSDTAVASFTFGTPTNSYANHNPQGNLDNIGVIGTAIYELDVGNPKRRYASSPTAQPNAFPAS